MNTTYGLNIIKYDLLKCKFPYLYDYKTYS